MAYLLDTNIFIEAQNRYYAPDICPGFWKWLEMQERTGAILSIGKVRDELIGRDDELAQWAHHRSTSFFQDVDAEVLPHLATLSTWVGSQRYRPGAIAEFLSSADYYLIATAMGNGHTVVTHETPSDGVKRVKMPEPCIAHGVQFVNTFGMLRRLGARFVLPAS